MPSSIAIVLWLVAVALKVLLLIALAAVAAWSLRRASAAARHALWTAALVGALAIAAAGPLPPSWSVPLTASLPFPVVERPPALERQSPSPDDVRPTASELVPSARSAGWLARVVLFVWVVGVGVFALRLVAGQVSLRRLEKRSRAIETGLARRLLDLRNVRLIETDELRTPATWGVIHPVIALPTTAAAWSAAHLETALRHEAAHVGRRDVLTQIVADGCCALLWFHPAVWYAAFRMRAERERACDDAVLAAGSANVEYAEMLVAVAAGVPRSIPTAVGMAHAGSLETRIRALLDPAIRRGSSRRMLACVSAAVLVAAAGLAGLGVARAAPEAGSDELASSERVPLSAERERSALDRRFRPRNERESLAIGRLQDAAKHVKQHEMDFIHDRAVWALSIARDDEVVAQLLEQLGSSDWRARAYAAWCLDVVGAVDARKPLTELLVDPVWRVRAMAATTLVGLPDAPPAEDVFPLLDDPAWQVRMPAVQLLARAGTPEAAEAIRARLNDPHIAVRNAAQAALDETGTP